MLETQKDQETLQDVTDFFEDIERLVENNPRLLGIFSNCASFQDELKMWHANSRRRTYETSSHNIRLQKKIQSSGFVDFSPCLH